MSTAIGVAVFNRHKNFMMGNTIGRMLGAHGVPSDVSDQDQQQSPDEMHSRQGALPQQIASFLQLLNTICLLKLVELNGSVPNDLVNNIPQQQVPANPQLVLNGHLFPDLEHEDIPQVQNLIEQPPNQALNVQNPQQQIPVVHGQPPNQPINFQNPQLHQIPLVNGQLQNPQLHQNPLVNGQLQVPVVYGQPPNQPLNAHNAQQQFPNLQMPVYAGLLNQHQNGYIRYQHPYAGNILPVPFQGNLPQQNLGIPRYNIPAGNMHGMIFPGHIPQQQPPFVYLPMMFPHFCIGNGHIPALPFAQNFPAPQNLLPQQNGPADSHSDEDSEDSA